MVEPVKPLRLLMPRRNEETGRIEWRLFLVTVSLLITTIGVEVCQNPAVLWLVAAQVLISYLLRLEIELVAEVEQRGGGNEDGLSVSLGMAHRTAGFWYTSPFPVSSTSSSSSRSSSEGAGSYTIGIKPHRNDSPRW
jgi:hypothetical protein